MDIEYWKDIPGFPHYEVSSLGRVRSWKITGWRYKFRELPKIKKLVSNGRYLGVGLVHKSKSYSKLIHCLVLQAFVGKRPKNCVASHVDGDHLNNSLDNLVYESQSKNLNRRYKHGTYYRLKLTEKQINKILALRTMGMTYLNIAKKFKISYATTWRINKIAEEIKNEGHR